MPASPHFTTVSLQQAFNTQRETLSGGLRAVPADLYGFGWQVLLGMPFELGQLGQPNVVLLDRDPVSVDLHGLTATYLVFLHAVEDRPLTLPADLAAPVSNSTNSGADSGGCVAEYELEYDGGEAVVTPILRRFAIQQSRIRWGASPFLAAAAADDQAFPTSGEAVRLGRAPVGTSGSAEVRTAAGRDSQPEYLWLYALPNPHPEKPIRRLRLRPGDERAVIYALSTTSVAEHPLRLCVREKARLALPPGARLNVIDELEGIDIDLGRVIRAYRALDYDPAAWAGPAPDAQPQPSPGSALVEYAAHPEARLYLDTGGDAPASYELSGLKGVGQISPVPPADQTVRLRVVDKTSGRPMPCRLHVHGPNGENLPPRGHHRTSNPYWFEDNYAEFVNGRNQYSYVSGVCEIELPLGEVFVEASRGMEWAPFRGALTVAPGTETLTVELAHSLQWREAGWVSADTHVHFLSPQTALLEGAAEDLNVVNLLASQWGEMFSNVGDFDGRSVLGAKDFGGDGEFLVRVGTENRQQVMGHISLLGYGGPMIHPLCTGGPSESALGDPLEVSMAEWAEQCIRQGGLVVMPHAPDPQAERAADVVLGLVHAIEMMTFNPYNAQVSPAGLADWYRFLNLGYHLPVVGGSDKMSATALLGGIRTYAQLAGQEFNYQNWMQAVRAGNTFVTVGPLVQMTVEGQAPGSVLRLPAGGGTLTVGWTVESTRLPIEQVEIIVGGERVESHVPAVAGYRASGSTAIKVSQSTWVAVRVRGSYRARPNDIAAHTSAVQVVVDDQPVFSPVEAGAVLRQIEGVLTYVQELAPRRSEAQLQRVRRPLVEAHAALHKRLHAHGVAH